MGGEYTVRPLSDRSWLMPASKRQRSRFDSTWSQTLSLLRREVEFLRGRDLVIGIDVHESDLRLDGTLRARAKAETPGVEVAFESKHGPLLYRCDQFVAAWHGREDWQENVRAIAKKLEALRAVDRYGGTSSGEQYRGYRQIAAAPAKMPPSVAETVIRDAAGCGVDTTLQTAYRLARRYSHPDVNAGDRTAWDRVVEAGESLGLG